MRGNIWRMKVGRCWMRSGGKPKGREEYIVIQRQDKKLIGDGTVRAGRSLGENLRKIRENGRGTWK